MRRRSDYRKRMPVLYEDEFRVIWETAGRARFIFGQIRDAIPAGFVKRQSNNGYIEDVGHLSQRYGYSNQRIWKLTEEMASLCEERFGKVDDDREEKSEQFVTGRQAGLRRDTMGGTHLSIVEREEIEQIINTFGLGSWATSEVKERLKLDMPGGKLIRWKSGGHIEMVEKRYGGRKPRNIWKITEHEYNLRVKCNPSLKVQA